MFQLLKRLMFQVMYMAGEQGGGGAAGGGDPGAGGGGQVQVTPADARKFVSDFVHDPKALEGMKDEDVLGYHGRLTQTLDKVRPVPKDGAWPEKWRDTYAKGDAKKAERLGRYSSPDAAIDALISVQNRISAGEMRSVLPKDADEATVKAWRAENGIPETADKYELKLREGLVIGEADKPYVQAFLAKGHAKNMNAEVASTVVEAYYDIVTQQAEQRATEDKQAATEAIAKLAAEWGTNYKGEMNMVHGLLETAPPGVKDIFLAGRGPDGKPLMANPDVIRTLNAWAREINPVTTVVQNSGANIGTAIEDEIKGIEEKMKDRQGPYYKGPLVEKNGRKDTEMAHRYHELLDAKERLGKKAA